MPFKKIDLFIVILIFASAACENNQLRDQSPAWSRPQNQPDIYVAGYTSSAAGRVTATYWKNGTAGRLSSYGVANAIALVLK